MTALLASVSGLDEAGIALRGGADLIDLKQPRAGALGALPDPLVARIVRWVDGRRPVSATTGDLPMISGVLAEAARAKAAAGVDFVKIGFFPGGDRAGSIRALGEVARTGVRLVAVLFADDRPDLATVDRLAEAGFTGAMLDTRDKRAGGLLSHLDNAALETFVAACRRRRLLCGLAGSLRTEDIAPLLSLGADYLGFRGALCGDADRTGALDAGALEKVRGLLPRSGAGPAAHASGVARRA